MPLFNLKQIHAIDRESAIASTNRRVVILKEVKDKLLAKKELTRDVLSEHLPSVSGIKAVKESEQNYISYEGNGRLVALQTVFKASDDIYVEIEEYYFKNPSKIIRRMNRVRELNCLR